MRAANEVKTGGPGGCDKRNQAESALWYRLRSRQLNGFKFVRQEPIGSYTVDHLRECRLLLK